MAVRWEEIKPGNWKAVCRFMDWQDSLYVDDPLYVPQLRVERKMFWDPHRNPFFSHADVTLWLLYRNEVLVGGISSHIDANSNTFHQEKAGFFGFFEALDEEAALALLDHAAAVLKAKGMNVIRGPFNFTTNHECGMLYEGFELGPAIMMTRNKPEYNEWLAAAGFSKAMDMWAWRMQTGPIPEGFAQLAAHVEQNTGVTIRRARKKDWKNEVEHIRAVYNDGWERNWGFIPFTPEEFDFVADGLKMLMKEEYSYIAFKGDKPVAMVVSLPDINPTVRRMGGKLFPFGWLHWLRMKPTGLRIVILGVIKELQHSGLGIPLYYRTWQAALANGVEWGEGSWILETNNPMNRALERMGFTIQQRFRIYEKSL